MYEPDFKIELMVDPVAKGRPRVCKTGRAYTPEKTRRAEDTMRWLIASALQGRTVPMFTGALHVEMEFSFQRPKSVKRASHTVKPDLDNLAKLAGDAGNGLIWNDDSQIENLRVQKFYGDRGLVRIRVWDMVDQTKFKGV
jgi:Holliday junction resolvase RusA-like endonuclease